MVLKDKVAVVTGCSKGIGLAIVNSLLEKGVKVAGWSRTSPSLQHPDFTFFKTDVRSFDSVKESYNNTFKAFGSVDILINNAGLGFAGNFEEMSVEDWTNMYETNVNGVFFCSKLVIPAMKKKGSGHIINIASVAGKEGFPLLAGYCGTKFAVRGISQAMYKEVRDYGVKVSVVSPGSVQTHFFDQIDHIQVNENMMRPEDIASSVIHILESSENYHPVELEVRPLMPQGRKKPS